jgi:periplasmic protein TonB
MKMKFQWKALQLSLFLHGIILLAVINISMSHIRPHNVLVIDFSMENEPYVREGSITAAVSLPAKLKENYKNWHSQETLQNDQNENYKPTVALEQSDTQDVLQKEPRTLVMPVTENNLDTKMGLTEFSHFGAQGIIRESGFQKVGTSVHSLGSSDYDASYKNKRYLKAHFSYIKDLIHKHLIYPAMAKKMGWEGKVIVSFIISSGGQARDIMLSKSSGHEILDDNALKAVRIAAPFPKPPVEAQIIVPVLYRLN